MIKRTIFAIAAAVVMTGAVAQDGTYFDNVNKNMQDNMSVRSMYTMKSYDDLSNWKDDSTWMKDVWMSMNARDAAALQQALWRLPSAEEMAVRKALQKCHVGSDAMFTKLREHNAMTVQGASTATIAATKFTMSDNDVWSSAMTGLTIYERKQLEWVWENMLPSERDALMSALRACHEHHWMGIHKGMSKGGY